MSKSLKSLSKDLSLKSIYGAQNEHMIHSLANTYSTVLQLVSEGFTVLVININDGIPVITINYCEKCLENWPITETSQVITSPDEPPKQYTSATTPRALIIWESKPH